MTRKDYVRIAHAVAQTRADLRDTAVHDGYAFVIYEKIIENLSDQLAADNPNFDRVRFKQACMIDYV